MHQCHFHHCPLILRLSRRDSLRFSLNLWLDFSFPCLWGLGVMSCPSPPVTFGSCGRLGLLIWAFLGWAGRGGVTGCVLGGGVTGFGGLPFTGVAGWPSNCCRAFLSFALTTTFFFSCLIILFRKSFSKPWVIGVSASKLWCIFPPIFEGRGSGCGHSLAKCPN